MSTTPQTKKQIKQTEKNQSAAIMLAIEIASNFKLFSYRIVDHEQFTLRTLELLQAFDHSYKPIPEDNTQINLQQ